MRYNIMKYITADTHFGHTNIIKYCYRPFKSVTEMNETIIKRWNRTVTIDDTIYHLGDFALTPKKVAERFCKRLNGYKILVLGNHDKKANYYYDIGFDEVYDTLITKDNFILSHVPLEISGVPSLNVGVDAWNFTPIPFPSIKQQVNLCGHIHEKWMVRV